jgi:maleylacetoacetate isomerase
MALAVACDIHPLNNLRVVQYLKRELGQSQETIDTWMRHWIAAGFRGLEAQATRHTADGRFMFGDSVSLADVLLVPQMYNARRCNCDLTPFHTLTRITAALEARPEFRAAAPELQPDAVT